MLDYGLVFKEVRAYYYILETVAPDYNHCRVYSDLICSPKAFCTANPTF